MNLISPIQAAFPLQIISEDFAVSDRKFNKNLYQNYFNYCEPMCDILIYQFRAYLLRLIASEHNVVVLLILLTITTLNDQYRNIVFQAFTAIFSIWRSLPAVSLPVHYIQLAGFNELI